MHDETEKNTDVHIKQVNGKYDTMISRKSFVGNAVFRVQSYFVFYAKR